jgi:hypothetical protein
MSRHKNFRRSRSVPSPAAVQKRERLEQAAAETMDEISAVNELIRHGGTRQDAEQLRQHFHKDAEEDPPSEIPED